MALYPSAPFDVASADGLYAIPPGSLAYRSITVGSGQALLLRLTHVAETQDFSMRCWISLVPDGVSVGSGLSAFWPLQRVGETIVVHDDLMTPDLPEGGGNARQLAVAAGAYTLNVLNLVNSENVFSFLASELG